MKGSLAKLDWIRGLAGSHERWEASRLFLSSRVGQECSDVYELQKRHFFKKGEKKNMD